MKHDTIRRIEVLVGIPACALLTILRRIVLFLRPAPVHTAPRRILFVKLIEQGATVLALDAIRLASERVGRENIYFCVFAENRFILDLLDVLPAENIFSIRGDHLSILLLDTIRALSQIRRARIDAVVDMEFFARASAILSFLSGAPMRAGLHRFTAESPYRGDLFTHRLQHNPYLHVAQAYRLLVEALWRDSTETPMMKVERQPTAPLPAFLPCDEERARVRAKLDQIAGRSVGTPIVLFNANAGDRLPLRRWPEDRFVELGRRLLAKRPDVTVVLTGAPSEQTSIEALRDRLGPAAISVAGHTTLREMLVLYTLADVLLTNDSGPGHFASLTEIESIVLFGPETPLLFGPIGPHSQAVTANLTCSPCLSAYNFRLSPCTHNACMHAITVDEVLARVHAALETRRANRAAHCGTA